MAMHGLTLDEDEDGWNISTCECGWESPPCPDAEIAAEFFADHYADERDR